MTQSYLERIRECQDLDSARAILGEHEDALNALQREFGLKPNVGDIDGAIRYGFSVIKPKDWEKYIKAARKTEGITEDQANELVALIGQGKHCHDHFQKMLDQGIKDQVAVEKTEKQKSDELIDQAAPVITRHTTKELPVHFSRREIERLNGELVSKLQEKNRQEELKKSTTSMYAAKIKEVGARIETLTTMISTGFETKTVDCEWRLNDPKPGLKTLVRLDTEEVIEQEKMLPSDRQLVLDDVKARAGTTERTLDEKPITEVDPDQKDEEEGAVDEGNDSDDDQSEEGESE